MHLHPLVPGAVAFCAGYLFTRATRSIALENMIDWNSCSASITLSGRVASNGNVINRINVAGLIVYS